MAADPVEDAPSVPALEESAVQLKTRDLLDPLGWELPVVCKDCDKQFQVPYRHFQAGVVFHCPHCHGSYVPTVPMYRQVRDTFETFYTRMRLERENMNEVGKDSVAVADRFRREFGEFQRGLERLAHELRPAGKMVRRKGLAAMFT